MTLEFQNFSAFLDEIQHISANLQTNLGTSLLNLHKDYVKDISLNNAIITVVLD